MLSTLALKKSDFEQEVGSFMGWGRGGPGGTPAWSATNVLNIQMDVASGLRRFYFVGHPWSFLKPMAEMTLPSGETTLTLPDDYCGVDGGCRIAVSQASDGLSRFFCYFTNPLRVVQALQATPEATGVPRLIAQRPVKAIQPGKMQRSELIVWPIPEQDYTLTFPYLIAPNYLLDITQPYAYGGVEHHETILECCLAAAEQRRDNALGVHTQKSEDLLGKSVHMDRLKNPIKLGQNLDFSDRTEWERWGRWNGHGWNPANGVNYEGVLHD